MGFLPAVLGGPKHIQPPNSPSRSISVERPATLPAWAFAPVVPPEGARAERPEFQTNGRNPQVRVG